MKFKLLAAVLMIGAAAKASLLTFSLQEVGSDVVATVSGSVNTDSLDLEMNGGWGESIVPNGGSLVLQPFPYESSYWWSGVTANDTSFGTGGASVGPDSFTGDVAGIVLSIGYVILDPDYNSGDLLAGSATWSNQSFSSLGITKGTYTATYGDTDSIQINVVPEPATAGMMTISAGILWLFRRLKKAANYYRT